MHVNDNYKKISPLITGTTTVGIVFKDGVILAADKRASAEYVISSKRAKKIIEITPRIYITISGLVADCQILARWLRQHLKQRYIIIKREPLVKEAASLLSLVMHSYFKQLLPFISHFLIAGYDRCGPHLYFLDHTGSVNEARIGFFSSGSGSPIAYSILETYYNKEMTEEEAIKLAIRAIASAIRRDAATGDGIDCVVITKEGGRRLKPEEIEKYLKEVGLSRIEREG